MDLHDGLLFVGWFLASLFGLRHFLRPPRAPIDNGRSILWHRWDDGGQIVSMPNHKDWSKEEFDNFSKMWETYVTKVPVPYLFLNFPVRIVHHPGPMMTPAPTPTLDWLIKELDG